MTTPIPIDKLAPDARVRVTQQISRREGHWHTQITGVVVRVETRPTGSWYVGKPAGRLPLIRLTLQKPDGELTILNLDADSQVELL